MPPGDSRALIEAELLLQQLAHEKGGPCVCADRPRQVVIWDGVADSDPKPCIACGWRPLVLDVIYAEAPPLVWASSR
jgi:hypothetical protein